MKNNENNLPNFVVYDVVFEGMSLNYDQGGGIQELKKITMPNGDVYTLVSRYALRYSILETMGGFAHHSVFKSTKENKESDQKKSIQLDLNEILNGNAFKYPEFCLFGFLITDPQIQRENPVKISHAISLTPFSNDVLFYANHSFARRLREKYKKASLEPNPFNKEEHYALYGYSLVVDVSKIKEFEFIYHYEKEKKDKKNKKSEQQAQQISSDEQNNDQNDVETLDNQLKDILKEVQKNNHKNISIDIDKNKVGSITFSPDNNKENTSKFIHVKVSLNDEYIRELLKKLDDAILNLKRNHQGRQADMKPILLVKQEIYDNSSYKTYLNKIRISQTVEEEYQIEKITNEPNKEVIKTRRNLLKGLTLKLTIDDENYEVRRLNEYENKKDGNNLSNKKFILVDGTKLSDQKEENLSKWYLNTVGMNSVLEIFNLSKAKGATDA